MLRTKPDWLKPLFPWEQRALVVNGRTMAYIDEGDPAARPVLLLSGNPTWGFLYRDFIAALTAAGYRAIAPDWIGAGYSDHPRVDSALTLAHHIADLVSLIDQLNLRGFVIVGQDWGGPQGVGAALQRVEKLSALVLMNTWLFTDFLSKFHKSPRPWTTWSAPLIGQFFMKRLKVLSQHGPSATTQRDMSETEARAYHHVFDEPDSDHVVLTWPRTIPMREGDRGLRAGQIYWRSAHDHLYSLELADLGRGHPAAATVYGHWDRYEPRPPEHEITADLLALAIWVAEIAESLNPSDIVKVAHFAGVKPGWPQGSVLRTPDDRFANLPGFPYEPKYVDVEGLRMAYVEHGRGDPILLLHGEPTWSYLYRHMIPPLALAGRVIAPDLIGFGRSDKPAAASAYTYKSHVRWLRALIQALDLDRITMVCQDWGGRLGLRVLSHIP